MEIVYYDLLQTRGPGRRPIDYTGALIWEASASRLWSISLYRDGEWLGRIHRGELVPTSLEGGHPTAEAAEEALASYLLAQGG